MNTQELAAASLALSKAFANLAALLQDAEADLAGLAQHETAEAVSTKSATVTEAEAKDALQCVVEKVGLPAAVALLKDFGAASFSKLDKKHYGEFVAKAKGLVE